MRQLLSNIKTCISHGRRLGLYLCSFGRNVRTYACILHKAFISRVNGENLFYFSTFYTSRRNQLNEMSIHISFVAVRSLLRLVHFSESVLLHRVMSIHKGMDDRSERDKDYVEQRVITDRLRASCISFSTLYFSLYAGS